MKNFIVSITLGLAVIVSCSRSPERTPYLSAKMTEYSEELDIISSDYSLKPIKYAQLTTGYEDFVMSYFGTGMLRNDSVNWMVMNSLAGTQIYVFKMEKDEGSDTYTDTIRHKYRDDSQMISLKITHDPSADEIKYVWLDENNEGSSEAVLIPLEQPLKKGKNFPELTVEQLDGEELSFRSLTGKTVVVNWWSTGCAPCIDEMPGFNDLKRQYEDNPDVVFIAIAHNDKEQVVRFLQNTEFDYIQTLANDRAVELFETSYPVNIIIAPDGRISYYSKGGHRDRYLDIERALKKITDNDKPTDQ